MRRDTDKLCAEGDEIRKPVYMYIYIYIYIRELDGKGRLFDICKLIEPSTRGNLINRTGGGC